ncbi:MAG: glycosyltransferase family 2 protein, partial [Myxococcales bacterium]|nr:glycosyltransferase family 2 protein [Myxococcales bacterium]
MVSVIVPCFNYGHYLGEALESVQRQSLTAWECIVIDDGSTDGTGEVAGSFASKDPRFSCVRQMNRGPSAARNAGLAKAAAPYVQLLDADDLLEPRKLEAHVGFLAEHADYDMVYSPMRFFTDTGSGRTFSRARNRSQRDWMILWPDTTDKFLLALVEGNTFPISAPVFRRLTLDEVGHFDESLLSHEDWEFWLRWAFAGKRFVGLDAPATRTLIREHGQSLTQR